MILPTEIYREVIERRKRYSDVKTKIQNGEITQINDFITYNLNIRQFAQDVIENTNDPDFLRHFYKAINSVTILDPTCGSGAFLFAAMNILEPLYEACLMRMRAFVEEEDRLNEEEKRSFKNHYKFFRQVLAETQNEHHPNLQYFIYKSIILQNLYGVDIMKEAVEIAKLRLFLKLVATVDADYRKPNLGLEPLPDIDFNIRAGNTLVGFATEKELEKCLVEDMMGAIVKQEIEEKCDIVARTFTRYKEIQLSTGDDYIDFKAAKEELNIRLKELNNELNQLLHKQASGLKYEDWLTSHQPFHWFAEFYEIIRDRGGFDVIIGNPPYLEARQIIYEVTGLSTKDSNAVHAMCIERSYNVLSNIGSMSMIVPLSIVCTQRMTEVQRIIENHGTTWYSNFSWRPGKLFDQVNRALTIFCSNQSDTPSKYSTQYMKWNAEHRDKLIPAISYVEYNVKRESFWFPKLSSLIELKILEKVLLKKSSISHYIGHTKNRVFYRTTGGLYWKVFTDFSPKFYLDGKEGHSSRETSFSVNGKDNNIQFVGLLSSNTFWWWYTITSNLRDMNPSDIHGLRFGKEIIETGSLINISKAYIEDLERNSEMLQRVQKNKGITQTQSFKILLSKPIIDQIDQMLAENYRFTEEELDFIINYDIKYRMGKELENGDEEE